MLTAVSLILGTFVRLWGVIGALQIINLWLGLYSAPGEWPWTYFFFLLLMPIFALHQLWSKPEYRCYYHSAVS